MEVGGGEGEVAGARLNGAAAAYLGRSKRDARTSTAEPEQRLAFCSHSLAFRVSESTETSAIWGRDGNLICKLLQDLTAHRWYCCSRNGVADAAREPAIRFHQRTIARAV